MRLALVSVLLVGSLQVAEAKKKNYNSHSGKTHWKKENECLKGQCKGINADENEGCLARCVSEACYNEVGLYIYMYLFIYLYIYIYMYLYVYVYIHMYTDTSYKYYVLLLLLLSYVYVIIACYLEVYESEPLEPGEVDKTRSGKFNSCAKREAEEEKKQKSESA